MKKDRELPQDKDNKGLYKKSIIKRIMPKISSKNIRYIIIWAIVIFLTYYFDNLGQGINPLILIGLGVSFTYLNSKS